MKAYFSDLAVFLLLLLFKLALTHSNKHEIEFISTTASVWPGLCTTGKKQSPIDLPFNWITSIKAAMTHRELDFNGGYKSDKFHMLNDGHTIQISFTKNLTSTAEMTGHGLDQSYIFAQAHFHWGQDPFKGSEHTINQQQFGMELHFVHYNSKYLSIGDALNSGDSKALLVVAVFLYPQLTNNPKFSENSGLAGITRQLPLPYSETSQEINEPLDLRQLLPKQGSIIYHYSGSLTIPNCEEVVEWFVVQKPVLVPLTDLQKFLSLQDAQGTKIKSNFRSVQSKSKRKISVFKST